MKIEIYGESEERVLRLKLEPWHAGVSVVAVDDRGETIERLLHISREGIHRHGAIDDSLGLPLSRGGFVMLVE